jgi:electron transport complex protein RnfD
MKNNKLLPAVKRVDGTTSMMADVIVALSPALIWGVAAFGVRALIVVLISVVSAVAAEALMRLILRRKQRFTDLYAVVAGMIIGLAMPAAVPYWVPAVGGAAASVIKQIFGGGRCPFNATVAANSLICIILPREMTLYTTSFEWLPLSNNIDVTPLKTPLELLAAGAIPNQTTMELALGKGVAHIGQLSALLLIAGGLYLLYRHVISWHIPFAFIATAATLFGFFPNSVDATGYVFGEILSGSLIFAAVFAATDFSGAPVNNYGKLAYGIACGALTVGLRYFAGISDGALTAVLIMSLLSRPIDILFSSFTFGQRDKKKNAALAKKMQKGE